MIYRLISLAALAAGGAYLANRIKQRNGGQAGPLVRETIIVEVPVHVAYDQWMRFEDYPLFMDGVQEVRLRDDNTVHWKANFSGSPVEWDAAITEQVPSQRMSWRCTTGAPGTGTLSLKPLTDNRTRVVLEMTFGEQEQNSASREELRAARVATRGNLRRFKELVEGRGQYTDAWPAAVTDQGTERGTGSVAGAAQ